MAVAAYICITYTFGHIFLRKWLCIYDNIGSLAPQRRGVLLTSRVLLLWTNIVRSSLAGSVHTVVVAGFGTASEKIDGSRPPG